MTLGTQEVTDTADLDVTNTAPDTVVTGSLTVTAGVPFTVKVGADDPSSADMAALFDYTIDWGDGSPVQIVSGPPRRWRRPAQIRVEGCWSPAS